MWVRKLLLSLLLSRQDHETINTALWYLLDQRKQLHERSQKAGNLVNTWQNEASWRCAARVFELFGGRV
jgi:hypothetical protein